MRRLLRRCGLGDRGEVDVGLDSTEEKEEEDDKGVEWERTKLRLDLKIKIKDLTVYTRSPYLA